MTDHKTADVMPVIEQNKAYHYAFEWFNKMLFDGKLSRPMLLFTRNAKIIGGYFSPDRWRNDDGIIAHEIAINANAFENGNVIRVFTILVHEMVHQWQHENGKPGRGGYHNKEWAAKCVEIGLKPISLDFPGKSTGEKIDTEIIDGGGTDKAIEQMPDRYVFVWETTPDQIEEPEGGGGGNSGDAEKKVPKSGKKQKYVCSICGDACWGKDSLEILCMKCNGPFERRITNE